MTDQKVFTVATKENVSIMKYFILETFPTKNINYACVLYKIAVWYKVGLFTWEVK